MHTIAGYLCRSIFKHAGRKRGLKNEGSWADYHQKEQEKGKEVKIIKKVPLPHSGRMNNRGLRSFNSKIIDLFVGEVKRKGR